MIVAGLDIGTSRSKASYIDDTGRPQIVLNQRGDPYTPSAVLFEEGICPIVGAEALAEAFLQPEHVLTHFKRVLGSPDVLYTDAKGKKYTATDLQSIVIRTFKQDIERRFNAELDEAVFTVPANFQDHKKQAAIKAAEMAKIKVVKLIHEPTAAGIAYALDKKQDQRFVVYDLGGGTFDVSVMEVASNSIRVLHTTGVERLGGADFNERIEKLVLERFAKENGFTPDKEEEPLFYQELAAKAEQIKIALSQKTKTRQVFSCKGHQLIVEISRDEFESSTSDLLKASLDCTQKAVEEAGLTWKEIDNIIMVGGAVRMAAVQSALADLSGIVPHCDLEPDRAVCYGAALQCAMELANAGKTIMIGGRAIPAPKAFVQEVTFHSVGCCVVDQNKELRNAVILPKATPIPTSKTDRFSLEHEAQTEARIEILQGEEGQPKDECLSIGQIVLSDLPSEHQRSKRIEVTYRIDKNGMIHATGRDLVSGKQVEVQVDYRKQVKPAA